MSLYVEQQFTGPVTVFTCSEIYEANVITDWRKAQSFLNCFFTKIL